MTPYPTLDADAAIVLKKLSQQLAREEELDYVGTEHVLLALLRHQGGLARRVLDEYGLDEMAVRKTLKQIRDADLEDTWVFGRLPGSPHYRNVLSLAINEATQLESSEIGTEHLLLALLREPNSTAERVLAVSGVSLLPTRARVLALLNAE